MKVEFDEWPEEYYSYGEFLSKTERGVYVQACHPIEGETTIFFFYGESWSDCGYFKLEQSFV